MYARRNLYGQSRTLLNYGLPLNYKQLDGDVKAIGICAYVKEDYSSLGTGSSNPLLAVFKVQTLILYGSYHPCIA